MKQFGAMICLGLLVACSSGKTPPQVDPPTELVTCVECGGNVRLPILNAGLAQGITITEIAEFQTVKGQLMQGGNVPPPLMWQNNSFPVRIVGKRDDLRLYLQTGSAWQAHPITATIRLVTITPQGFITNLLTSMPYTPKGASKDEDLTSTLNITLPGRLLVPDTQYSVSLTDTTDGLPAKTSDNARFPRDGSIIPLGVMGYMDKVRVMLVPVQYNADGSGRLPDTSDPQVELYRKVFYQIFPAAEAVILVREPFPWSQPMDFGGGGWGTLLTAIQNLRGTDKADGDIYYHGLVNPSASQGGGIAGLGSLGGPFSIGIGYPGESTAWIAAHEVGHAHGLHHANCGGAALGPDMGGPYMDGGIGVWGYNQLTGKLIDPSGQAMTKPHDFMSYCPQGQWVSDYHYSMLESRVQGDNRIVAYQTENLYPTTIVGDQISVGDTPQKVNVDNAEKRAIDVGGTAHTGYWFPYDHLPGGTLMVPEGVHAMSRWSAVRMK